MQAARAEVQSLASCQVLQGSHAPLRVQFLGCVAYQPVLELQESLVAAKLAGELADDLLLLEHEAVYTLGRGAAEADLRGAPTITGVPMFRVGRGGGVTFHGPGQLVGYPIVHLRPSRDVQRYVRVLERSLISTCEGLGIEACARPGETGVWVGEEKIASIGIGVRRGIAYHGVALNVTTDLTFFDRIVPCRTAGLRMTSIMRSLGCSPPMTSVADRFAESFAAAFFGGVCDGGRIA